MNQVKIVVGSIVGFVVLVLLFSSFGTVTAGNIGVKTRFSAVVSTMEPGLYFKLPFLEGVKEVNVQTQKEQITAQSASSDLQTVTAVIALNYNVDATKVGQLYSDIGLNYRERVIDPAIQEAVKAATAKFTAEQLITKRQEVRDEIKNHLRERLAPDFITVSDFSIVNFDFSPSFNKAIEEKVTAEQNALAAKNKLEQVKFEAEQRVATANAEAEAIRVQSNAANNEKYVNLKALEVQKAAIDKWDGKLPQQFVPGSAIPFLDLK